MAGKERLDALLVSRGRFETRSKARAAIMAGVVYVDGRRVDKAGALVDPEAHIEVRGAPIPFVSRGGVKLAAALDRFGLNPAGKVCLDVGASTGGFTDCLLQRGARLVHAVDVGYGQLAWSLRQDPRVIVWERTNFRYVTPEQISGIEFVAVDVSFISLRLILPVARTLVVPEADAVTLVKPQFEAGPARVGKGGVVRRPEVHVDVLKELFAWARAAGGWEPRGLCYSPITGPEGNIEFFVWWRAERGETGAAATAAGAECGLGENAGAGGAAPRGEGARESEPGAGGGFDADAAAEAVVREAWAELGKE